MVLFIIVIFCDNQKRKFFFLYSNYLFHLFFNDYKCALQKIIEKLNDFKMNDQDKEKNLSLFLVSTLSHTHIYKMDFEFWF